MRQLRPAIALFATLIVLAWLAPTAPVLALDRGVSRALFALPHGVLDLLDVVWVIGALPVTALLVLLATLGLPLPWRQRVGVWAGFAAVGLCELAIKHWVATPAPHSLVTEPPFLAALERLVNLAPATIAPAVRLTGSFPSGHVARLTFLAGCVVPRPCTGWLVGVAALAAVAVVATGGHWVWDTLGALTLALGWLAVAGRWRP